MLFFFFLAGKGDFEEGYVRGFRDANKLGSGAARDRLDSEYAGMKKDFQLGYMQGRSDAGGALSRSMHDLVMTRQSNVGGYSAGYMQVSNFFFH